MKQARQLMLLRHGKAVRGGGLDDRARPLRDTGKDEARQVAAVAAAHGLMPTLIICSTAVRARQTADLFAEQTGAECGIVRMQELYLASPAEIMSAVRTVPGHVRSLLVVGHNPGMETLVQPCRGDSRTDRRLPTAGLAVFNVHSKRWDSLRLEDLELLRVITPLPTAGGTG